MTRTYDYNGYIVKVSPEGVMIFKDRAWRSLDAIVSKPWIIERSKG